jgi:hypothetical protein
VLAVAEVEPGGRPDAREDAGHPGLAEDAPGPEHEHVRSLDARSRHALEVSGGKAVSPLPPSRLRDYDRVVKRLLSPAVLVVAAIAAAVMPAAALAPPGGWNGTNPFNCVVQHAGLGATVPNPRADPYCVDFDKTHQNIADLGIVDFLSKEPARTAAAVPKCFYFQSDHWVSAVIQGDASTALYQWDGHYFFDKATGDGGAWITNFKVNGRTFDPSAIPGIPQQYAQYLGPGTGGAITHDSIPADPACVARAARGGVYASAAATRCMPASGGVGAGHIGAIELGETETSLRSRLGAPQSVERGYLRYCLTGGAALLAGEAADRSGDPQIATAQPIRLIYTTRSAFSLHGAGPGTTVASLRRRLPRSVRVLRYDGISLYALRRGANILFGARRGRVRFVAVYDARHIRRAALAGWLRRAA